MPVEAEVPAPEPSSEAVTAEAGFSAPVAPIESAESGIAQTVSSTSSATVKKTEDGKWKVDTGYIDHRTKDPNRLESRRSALDETGAPVAPVARSERDEEGKFKVRLLFQLCVRDITTKMVPQRVPRQQRRTNIQIKGWRQRHKRRLQ